MTYHDTLRTLFDLDNRISLFQEENVGAFEVSRLRKQTTAVLSH